MLGAGYGQAALDPTAPESFHFIKNDSPLYEAMSSWWLIECP